MQLTAISLALAAVLAGTAAAAETRIASWNLNNLHHELGEPLRERAPVRDVIDIESLRKYRDRADADIYALQEVNGPRAARLVFPADEWDVFFSGRYADDLVAGRQSDRIYTGFAVRRGAFDAVSKRDVAELSVRHEDGRPTRWGTEILVEKDGQLLRLMSVHLKSGYHGGSLEPASRPDCVTLAAQRAPLEAWIDAAAEAQVPFVILGDWNRRIDVHGQNDHIWGEIDDGDPPGLDLWRLPFNRESTCNAGFSQPIDFLVFDDRAWRLVDAASYEEVVYDDEDWDARRRTPSDHCPIVVALDWPSTETARAETTEADTEEARTARALPTLSPYSKLDPSGVTVSGLSSGGFFAHQFHIAHSDLVNGAAVLAGGPYACAEQIPTALSFNPLASIIVALSVCTHGARDTFDPWNLWLPQWPSVEESVAATMTEHAMGRIDDPSNLADDRVWLLAGIKDDVVPVSTVQVLEAYYRRMGLSAPALHLELDANANHGVPIEEFTGTSAWPSRMCGEYELPFVIDCDYDAAEKLLRHLYPQGFSAQPAVPDRSRLFAFDQSEFFSPAEASVSLADAGYVYVPADCLDEAASTEVCHLHVALHGCRQYSGLVDDDFYWDGGYNAWAEANRIVVLYPQTTAWKRPSDITGLTANPKGCWDWWGYSGPDYYRQDGKQMQAVRAMIERMLPD
jgi:poly(3-hydroxybutyrate) depolymerase/endonuclease/exonuclease/phosphatase family metal-dependent hydrolase